MEGKIITSSVGVQMQRIHIVGCGPRSGTTLIAEAMIACFEIDLYNEHETRIWAWPSCYANIFLTKAPIDILLVQSVLRVMPNLHVIYMLRDPRDMIVSKHGNDPNRYWASLSLWKTYTPYGHRLQAHPRFITIRYEDLVNAPDQIQAYLMKRMPFLVRQASFSRYHELSQPSSASVNALGLVRPISSSNVGNWRRHMPRVAGQLEIHGSITNDLIEYGYEQDGAWEQELEGVQPDLSESHWPEHFPKKTLRKYTLGKNMMAIWVLLGNYKLLLSMKRGVKMLSPKLGPLIRRLFLFGRKDTS